MEECWGRERGRERKKNEIERDRNACKKIDKLILRKESV
jgi:hypothetical protein